MISEEQLDAYRLEGTQVRVVRDAIADNDVTGIVVAWDDEVVAIRRPNRRIVKVKRKYIIEPADGPRSNPLE